MAACGSTLPKGGGILLLAGLALLMSEKVVTRRSSAGGGSLVRLLTSTRYLVKPREKLRLRL